MVLNRPAWALHMDDDAEHASRARRELRKLIEVSNLLLTGASLSFTFETTSW